MDRNGPVGYLVPDVDLRSVALHIGKSVGVPDSVHGARAFSQISENGPGSA